MGNKAKILLVLALVGVIAGGCVWAALRWSDGGVDEGSASGPTGGESASPSVPLGQPDDGTVTRVWVSDTSMVYVLDRMAREDPSDIGVRGSPDDPYREVGDDLWETNIDYLLDSGLLEETDSGYRVNTHVSPIEASTQMPDDPFEGVRSALHITLRASDVAWCDMGTLSGYEFARSYVDEYYRSYSTHSEYEESIESYVACEGG